MQLFRKTIVFISGIALVGTLAGCASAAPDQTGASPTEELTQTATPNEQLPDPRELTGLSEVAEVPPIEPIVESPTPALPVTVTGDDGVETTVDSADRIVTLDIYGTTSQTLIGLGLENNIAGRTISDISPQIADVPVVSGDGHAVDVEAVLAVKPTLVFADTTLGPASAIDLLRNSGIDVVVLSPDRGADLIAEQIAAIAEATGIPDVGAKLIERTETDLAAAQEYVASLAPQNGEPLRMVVLYVRGNAGVFFIFGKGSASVALIEDLGGQAIAADAGLGETVPATAESLVQIDPEVMLVMSDGLESTGGLSGLLERPGIAQTTAGAKERVVSAPDSQLISFGPNYPAALRALGDAIYRG